MSAKRDSELLRGLPSADLEKILALAVRRRLGEGDVLFRLGDEAEGIFLVQTGQVSLSLPLRLEGKEQDLQVEERRPGQLLGWSGLVPPHRFTLQARATQVTELLALGRSDLLSLFSERPEVGHVVFSNLARIVGQRLQVFQAIWLREVQRRVAARQV